MPRPIQHERQRRFQGKHSTEKTSISITVNEKAVLDHPTRAGRFQDRGMADGVHGFVRLLQDVDYYFDVGQRRFCRYNGLLVDRVTACSVFRALHAS